MKNQMKILMIGFFLFPIFTWAGGSAATSQPLATQAAMEILRSGGSATDAACAAAFTLNVVQPYFAGIGGGGFALYQKGSKTNFVDFREVAPQATTSRLFFEAGKPIESWSKRNTGGKSVGLPGLVAGCAELNRQNGKLPWKRLFETAIKIANEGFSVSQMFQEELSDQWARVSPFDFTKKTFGGASGTGIKKDEILKQPLLAETLRTIAGLGASEFYQGALAASWLKEAQALGVSITASELGNYTAIARNPVVFQTSYLSGETSPEPSSAGIMVAGVLRYLDHYRQHRLDLKLGSPEQVVAFLEATVAFGKIRSEKISDPSRHSKRPPRFLESTDETKLWKQIDRKIAERLAKLTKPGASDSLPAPGTNAADQPSHTAHISVVDASGFAAALTTSAGNIFGSGITVPKHGFILSSTMGDFDKTDDTVNAPAAGKRPRSNMSPTILYQTAHGKKSPIAVLGAAGGPLIPQAMVQFIENYFRFGLDAVQAVKQPRFSIDDEGKVEIEKTAPVELISALKTAGYDVTPVDTVWAVMQAIVRKDPQSKWEVVTEPRYDGLAITE